MADSRWQTSDRGSRGRGNGFAPQGQAMLSASAWRRVGHELGLSPRELELVRHVFDGKKLTAVASEMKLALGTVKTYTERIHRKLEVRDQRELALAVFSAYLRITPSMTARRTTGTKPSSR